LGSDEDVGAAVVDSPGVVDHDVEDDASGREGDRSEEHAASRPSSAATATTSRAGRAIGSSACTA
jgi:hypothetical protein